MLDNRSSPASFVWRLCMSEPQRAHSSPEGSPVGNDRARSSRIEQLLLAGLDRYFAGRYEEAIDVWTRVAFLERRHGPARAYIERARGALAERQREAEELVGRGRQAFEGGDLSVARALLTEAVLQGGGDTARLLLDRMDRVAMVASASDGTHQGTPEPEERRDTTRVAWAATACVCAGVVAATLTVGRMVSATIADWPASGLPASQHAEPLPRVSLGDATVQRARQRYVAGHTGEAIRLLDAVDVADAARPAADELRATWQHEVLAADASRRRATEGGRP
jgi:hypothetical protein